MNLRTTLIAGLAAAVLPAAAWAQAPCAIPFQSYLVDEDGTPSNSPIDIEVIFYDGADAGAAGIDCRVFNAVAVNNGWLNLSIDACSLPEPGPSGCGVMTVTEILEAGAAEGAQVYMALRLGDDLADAGPRTPLGAVPYAVYATSAQTAVTATSAAQADVAAELAGFTPADYATVASMSPVASSGLFSDLVGVPSGLSDGDSDTLGALVCTAGQIAVFDAGVGGWVCGDAPGGGGGDGVVFGEETLTVGTRDEGNAYASLDTPLAVPDNVVTGVTSARFVSDDITIRTVSLDLVVDHPDPSQLTVTLTSPAGTVLTIVDGATTSLTDINGNFGWDNEIEGGNLYAFFEESTAGVWTLKVVDGAAGSTGSLTSWKLRVNENWTGTAFVGAEIETPGRVVANEVVIANGGHIAFVDEDGNATRTISGRRDFRPVSYSGRIATGVMRMPESFLGDTAIFSEIHLPAGSVATISGGVRCSIGYPAGTYGDTNIGCRMFVLDEAGATVPLIGAYLTEYDSACNSVPGDILLLSGCRGVHNRNIPVREWNGTYYVFAETDMTISVVAEVFCRANCNYTSCGDYSCTMTNDLTLAVR